MEITLPVVGQVPEVSEMDILEMYIAKDKGNGDVFVVMRVPTYGTHDRVLYFRDDGRVLHGGFDHFEESYNLVRKFTSADVLTIRGS